MKVPGQQSGTEGYAEEETGQTEQPETRLCENGDERNKDGQNKDAGIPACETERESVGKRGYV